jgi:hypothetical protein
MSAVKLLYPLSAVATDASWQFGLWGSDWATQKYAEEISSLRLPPLCVILTLSYPYNRVQKLYDVNITTKKQRGLSPRASYTDRETAACRRS